VVGASGGRIAQSATGNGQIGGGARLDAKIGIGAWFGLTMFGLTIAAIVVLPN
jgi:hypothetical protein